MWDGPGERRRHAEVAGELLDPGTFGPVADQQQGGVRHGRRPPRPPARAHGTVGSCRPTRPRSGLRVPGGAGAARGRAARAKRSRSTPVGVSSTRFSGTPMRSTCSTTAFAAAGDQVGAEQRRSFGARCSSQRPQPGRVVPHCSASHTLAAGTNSTDGALRRRARTSPAVWNRSWRCHTKVDVGARPWAVGVDGEPPAQPPVEHVLGGGLGDGREPLADTGSPGAAEGGVGPSAARLGRCEDPAWGHHP